MAPKPFFEFPQARRRWPPNPPFDPVSWPFQPYVTRRSIDGNLNPRIWVRQITVSFNVLPPYACPNLLTHKTFFPHGKPVSRFISGVPRRPILPAAEGRRGFRDRPRKVIRPPAHAFPW